MCLFVDIPHEYLIFTDAQLHMMKENLLTIMILRPFKMTLGN